MKWLRRFQINNLIEELEDLKEAEATPYELWFREGQEEIRKLEKEIKNLKEDFRLFKIRHAELAIEYGKLLNEKDKCSPSS